MQMVQKMLATRGGTVAVGGFAAAFGALLLLMYLAQYRNSVDESGEPITVLVAKSLIEKGTPGDIVGLKGLFQTTDAPRDQLEDGAITDPSALRGRLATTDVYPGQQLTTGDFSASASGALGAQIAGNQRAISVPVDTAHGMVGQLRTGDRIDVLAGFNVTTGAGGGFSARPVVKVLTQNVLVLEAPKRAATGVASNSANVVLRTNYREAAEIAWAVDNGKIWVVLRPRGGAPVKRAQVITPEALLGVRPVGMRP
jgi:Flp pilus assembly protein CpaB